MTSSTAPVPGTRTTTASAADARPLPAAAGFRHRWVQAGQVRLHVAEFGAGEPVLLLHGFPQHWHAWHRVAEHADPGLRLVCPDLRGFGWSEQPPRGYDLDTLAADLLALLDVLGLDRVALVGHGWGAHVGFRLCRRAPERVRGFLALNLAHPGVPHRAILPNLWRQWYTAFVEYPVIGRAVLRRLPRFTRFLLRHQAADPSAWTEAELAEYAAATQAAARAGQAMFWQFVLREIPALLRGDARHDRLGVPALLLGGGRDKVYPPAMLAGARSADADAAGIGVRIVPGAGHFLPQERPDAVAAAMAELFAVTR